MELTFQLYLGEMQIVLWYNRGGDGDYRLTMPANRIKSAKDRAHTMEDDTENHAANHRWYPMPTKVLISAIIR